LFFIFYFQKIIKNYELVVCESNEIDESSFAGIKLTEFEAERFARIINNLNDSKERIKVIIDCPSIGISSWTDLLKPKIKNLSNLELVIEHKADQNYLAVSAASILAKCERERAMDKLKEEYGTEIGSGYCADPATIRFLEKNADKHKDDGIFRKTWETWRKAFEGIQPQLRQIPPSLSRSMMATFKPSCAALIAATYPPGPEPMTVRSNCFSAMNILSRLEAELSRSSCPRGSEH